jgi:hypothetical protein
MDEDVTGDGWWSSSIERVEGFTGCLWMLVQAIEVRELTGIKLAAASCSSRRRRLIWGKTKFKLTGARLLVILGGEVGDDVAKLATGSIYSACKRWPVNQATTRGGRRRKRLLAQWLGG